MELNCLVQVTTDRQVDFVEWLDYHTSMGFDHIFVFDTGERDWLDGLCERYRNVVLVPRGDGDWKRRGVVVQTYVSRRKAAEWCVALQDDEFIWFDMPKFGTIKRYIESVAMRSGSEALTGYYTYISSEKGMANRVGSKIDCFMHVRQDPQNVTAPCQLTPFGGVTFFYISNPNVMPLKGPIEPVSVMWVDANGARLNRQVLESVARNGFYRSRYAMRIYKYALKSGKEMEFKDGTRPVGYVETDMSMQVARKNLLGIPVSQDTEALFAKDKDFVEPVAKPLTSPRQYETMEAGLGVTRAKIDQMILEGNYFEDICDYMEQRGLEYNKDILLKAFDREREIIAESSPTYKLVQQMLNENRSRKEICQTAGLSEVAVERMISCLKVLDIQTDEGPGPSKTVMDAVGMFEAKDAETTAADIVQNDEKFAKANQKRLEALKKGREARKAKKEAEKAKGEQERPAKTDTKKGSKKAKKETKKVSKPNAEVEVSDGAEAIDKALEGIDFDGMNI